MDKRLKSMHQAVRGECAVLFEWSFHTAWRWIRREFGFRRLSQRWSHTLVTVSGRGSDGCLKVYRQVRMNDLHWSCVRIACREGQVRRQGKFRRRAATAPDSWRVLRKASCQILSA